MRFFPKKRPVNNLHLVLLFIIFILLLSSLFHPFHSFCSHSQQVVPHTFYYRQPESSVYSSADPSIAHVSAHRVPTTLLSPLHLRGQFPRPLTAPHLRHLSFRCSAWGLSPTGDLLTSQAWPSGSTRAFMLPEATLREGLVKSTCFCEFSPFLFQINWGYRVPTVYLLKHSLCLNGPRQFQPVCSKVNCTVTWFLIESSHIPYQIWET